MAFARPTGRLFAYSVYLLRLANWTILRNNGDGLSPSLPTDLRHGGREENPCLVFWVSCSSLLHPPLLSGWVWSRVWWYNRYLHPSLKPLETSKKRHASVAQLDRALVFGTRGWGFKSLRAYFFLTGVSRHYSNRRTCGPCARVELF